MDVWSSYVTKYVYIESLYGYASPSQHTTEAERKLSVNCINTAFHRNQATLSAWSLS